MISIDIALQKVNSYLEESDSKLSGEVVLLEGETMEYEFGWVFFYQSKKFVETGNILLALAGNAPIIINKYDGSMHFTGTAHPVEKYIADYMKEFRKKYPK